jgi:hypothetical protein
MPSQTSEHCDTILVIPAMFNRSRRRLTGGAPPANSHYGDT